MSGKNYVDHWREAVWQDDKLKAPEKLLLLAHARFADFETGANCRPGAAKLATLAGMSTRTVHTRRQKLEKAGWLTLVGERGGAPKGDYRTTSNYQLTFPRTSERASPVDGETGEDSARTSERNDADWCENFTPPPKTTSDHLVAETGEETSPVDDGPCSVCEGKGYHDLLGKRRECKPCQMKRERVA